jgi:hypothetical protein
MESLERRMLMAATSLDNVQVTSDPDVQNQPSLVADPLDARHVAIAYLDRSLVGGGYSGVGVSVSRDGGTT